MKPLIKRIIASSVRNLLENQPTVFSFTPETGPTEWNFTHHLAFEIQRYLPWLDHDVELTKRNHESRRPDIVFTGEEATGLIFWSSKLRSIRT